MKDIKIVTIIYGEGTSDSVISALTSVKEQKLKPIKIYLCIEPTSILNINKLMLSNNELFNDVAIIPNEGDYNPIHNINEGVRTALREIDDVFFIALLNEFDSWEKTYLHFVRNLIESRVSEYNSFLANKNIEEKKYTEEVLGLKMNKTPDCVFTHINDNFKKEDMIENILLNNIRLYYSNWIIKSTTLLFLIEKIINVIGESDRSLNIEIFKDQTLQVENVVSGDVKNKFNSNSTHSYSREFYNKGATENFYENQNEFIYRNKNLKKEILKKYERHGDIFLKF